MNNPTKKTINNQKLNILLDIFFIISLSLCFYLTTPIQTSKVVFIPKGGISGIIAHLNKNGFDMNKIDGILIKFFGHIQSGWLNMEEENITKGDFLYKLANAKAALENITLIPGETLYFFIENLSAQLGLDKAKLYASYYKYAPFGDGVILANTYKIPKGISEDHLMYYLVNNSLKEHRELAKKFLGEYDERQWFKYVTTASVIQKESASVEEMPIVSAVIRNRLKIKMPLQMDGTLNYGRFSHTKVTPQMIRNDTSHYNTYKNHGIPKEPVSSVSIDAIKAAIFPADVDYLYFVRTKDGKHSFTKSYKEHRDNFSK